MFQMSERKGVTESSEVDASEAKQGTKKYQILVNFPENMNSHLTDICRAVDGHGPV